uniref:Uncharacterized protein n=1 Tax=Caenorhabditis tropicalis TaxID=1561998 RepID=A0A1I7U3S0_9PELO
MASRRFRTQAERDGRKMVHTRTTDVRNGNHPRTNCLVRGWTILRTSAFKNRAAWTRPLRFQYSLLE